MYLWFGLGIFLLGSGVGALLTRIAMLGEIRRLRAEIQSHDAQRSEKEPGAGQAA